MRRQRTIERFVFTAIWLAHLGNKASKAPTLHAPGGGPACVGRIQLGGIRLGLPVPNRRQVELLSLLRRHLALVGGAKNALDGIDNLASSPKNPVGVAEP